jgi:GT2 family glycosyltransferase
MALGELLERLGDLRDAAFEICVVHGPTEDGTKAVLQKWKRRIKVAANPERNLSISRNIGIAMAAGDFVAFIDDDAFPSPQWLSELAAAFGDPKVGGAGGVVMDHTGAKTQYVFSSANRLGNTNSCHKMPVESTPFSFEFPYLQGVNCAFRREALLSVGGFDEEFDFYLDETDLCCRLIDAGWVVKQLPNAIVHHRSLPSAIRDEQKITHSRYSVLKNKLYFSLVNSPAHHQAEQAIQDMKVFVAGNEEDIRHHTESGQLPPGTLDAFHADAARAWKVGLERGMSGERRLMDPKLPRRLRWRFRKFPLPETRF